MSYSKQAKLYRRICIEQYKRCSLCYEPMVLLHHIIPKSAGGNNGRDNLVGLCTVCHSQLHARYNREAIGFVREQIGDQFFENVYTELLEAI